MSNSKPQQSLLTRQQQKALDKELPWRVIVEKGGDYLAEFIKAAQDEEKSWMRFGSVEPIDQKTADQIMSTAKGRKRVLRSRAAYRDKAKGCGHLRAKARVVALGCLDPDLYTLPARVQLHCGSQRCWSMPFHFLAETGKWTTMVQFGIFGVATLRPSSSKGNQILEMSPCIWHHQETRSAFLRSPWYLVKGTSMV